MYNNSNNSIVYSNTPNYLEIGKFKNHKLLIDTLKRICITCKHCIINNSGINKYI